MSRISRLSIIFAGLSLVALAGPVACTRLPLLAPTGSVINLTVASDVVSLNSSVDVIAVVIENGASSSGTGTGTSTSTAGQGTPVQDGTVVSFTTTIGTIEPSEAKTQNGKVSVKLVTNGQSGKANIIAYSGGAKSTATVTIGAAAVDHILVTASPANLSSNGGSATISARAEDVSGNGQAGVQVEFTTTKGTLSAAAATTNSSGVATTTLTTATGPVDVTATVGAKTAKVTVGVATKATLSISMTTTPPVSTSMAASFTVDAGSVTGVPVTGITVNYGDGQTAQLGSFSGTRTVQHFYSRDDIFNVTVSATDPDGVAVSSQTQIAIVKLSASVAVPAPSTSGVPKTVTGTITLEPTSAVIDHYEWTFEDGATAITSFSKTQTYTYTTAGTKNVSVRVVPSYGSAFTVTTQVVITP